MKIGDDYEVIEDETAPKGRRIIKIGQVEKAEKEQVSNKVVNFASNAPKKRGRPPKRD
jgi:hypothetical protein